MAARVASLTERQQRIRAVRADAGRRCAETRGADNIMPLQTVRQSSLTGRIDAPEPPWGGGQPGARRRAVWRGAPIDLGTFC
jgi:hypothetical protein